MKNSPARPSAARDAYRCRQLAPRRASLLLAAWAALGIACSEPGTANPVDDGTDSGDVTGTSSTSTGGDEGQTSPFFSEAERSVILTWLGPMPDSPPPDPTNAYAENAEAAILGQKLFFDNRISGSGTVSCGTCHKGEVGFSDERQFSIGAGMSGRSTQGLLNGAYGAASSDSAEESTNWQNWTGRCDSQWCQALGSPESSTSLGGARMVVSLLLYDVYRDEYEAIFGSMPEMRDGEGDPIAPVDQKPGDPGWDELTDEVKHDVISVYVNYGKSVAAYERKLESRDSRFDEFWHELDGGAEDSGALSAQEKLGLRVFVGPGRCIGCHGGPNFTDWQFHNIAIPQLGENVAESDDGRVRGVGRLLGSEWNCAGEWSDHPDKSKCAVSNLTEDDAELGAFKTPSLRGIGSSAPYMHTGTFTTLMEVVRHYDNGGAASSSFSGVRDELMRPLGLSEEQRVALVAFMLALEGVPVDTALWGPPPA